MEKILVNDETVAKVLQKIEDGKELTQEDKIILQNNPNAVSQDYNPRIYMRHRSGGLYVDIGNWNYNGFFNRTPTAYGETVRTKLDEFGDSLKSLWIDGRMAIMVTSKKPAVFQVYSEE